MIKRLLATGYKPHELGIFNNKHEGIPYIKKAFQKRLRAFIEEELEWLIISGQLGAELWAAEVYLQLKKEFPHLQLAVITPFIDQEENWQDEKKDYYNEIISQADFVTSITKRKYEGPWQFKAKNSFLIDNSDGLLVLYDEEKEGSPKYIIDLAKKRVENDDYQLFTINSFDLQSIVEEEQLNQYGFE